MKTNTARLLTDGRGASIAKVFHIQDRRVSAVIARYPLAAAVACRCHDCGLETVAGVDDMVRDGFGRLTPDELEKRLKCERGSCGGDVTVAIRPWFEFAQQK